MEINWPGFRAPAGVNCLAQALDSANRRGTVKRNETVSIRSLSRGSEFGAKTGGRRRIDFLVAGSGASAGAVAWQHVQTGGSRVTDDHGRVDESGQAEGGDG